MGRKKWTVNVKNFILDQWHVLRRIPPEIILEQRYLKFRQMGEVEIEEKLD